MHMIPGYGMFWPILVITAMWLGLIILGIFLLAKYFSDERKKPPEQILKERLAKGKIDVAEYERLLPIIKDGGRSKEDA
ncbi:MAG TPA: SHOCT domain-containing protein [Candidatus Avamphibacillus sp.]|nr:SHOCT domain-containing protein [Candidatus Avamphibacillus sp.]